MNYSFEGRIFYGNRKNLTHDNLVFLEAWLAGYDAEDEERATEIANLLDWLNHHIVKQHMKDAKKFLRESQKAGE